MERNWLTINNKAEDVVEITIEGTIGSYWKNNNEAILTKEEMASQLKQIANLKTKNIIVHINSYGGDVTHGISIHDLLASNEASVTTIVNGHTASAATIIAQAGNVRKMSANALYLVHNASMIAWGDKNELKVTIDDLEKVDTTLANIYSKRTGKSVEDILEQMNKFNGRGEWMTADEAKEFGLIDEVYEPMKAVATIDKEILSRFGLPELPVNQIEINQNPKNTMKKYALTTMAAIAAFFGKQVTEEFEPTQDDLQKMNDELHTRQESIDTLTAEKTALQTEKEAAEAKAVKAEADLATATVKAEELQGKLDAAATPPAHVKIPQDNIDKSADADFDVINSLPHNVAADLNILK